MSDTKMRDIVREQFEVSLCKESNCETSMHAALLLERRLGNGDYLNPKASIGWWAWNQSRSDLAVILPALRKDSDADDIAGVGLVIPMFDRGYDEALEEARVAIEAAGIKVEFAE